MDASLAISQVSQLVFVTWVRVSHPSRRMDLHNRSKNSGRPRRKPEQELYKSRIDHQWGQERAEGCVKNVAYQLHLNNDIIWDIKHTAHR